MGRNQTPRKNPETKKVPLKAVFFDAGNTLLRPYPSVGHIYAHYARRHGVHAAPALVDGRFRAAWAARHGLRQLAQDHTEKLWWRRMVQKVWQGFFRPQTFERYFEELYGAFAHPRHWRLFPDTLPTLRALRRRGLALGIVSNWDSRLVTLAEEIGLTKSVDFILVSAVEGLVKPDRKIFRRALAKAGVAAPEALHVGDSLKEDYLGARAAGLKALLLERGGAAPKDTAAIASLAQVVQFVKTAP